MGAWGPGIFQRDDDLDAIAQLEDLLDFDPEKGEFLRGHKDPLALRNWLNETGIHRVLNLILPAYRAHINNNERRFGRHLVVLFTVICIELGCTIPDSLLTVTDHEREKMGYDDEGVAQIAAALEAHTPGERYDVGSLGRRQTMKTAGNKEAAQHLRDRRAEGSYPNDSCGGCGERATPDGEPLLACAKCKFRKYCGLKCQEKHWPKHKKVCRSQEEIDAIKASAKKTLMYSVSDPNVMMPLLESTKDAPK